MISINMISQNSKINASFLIIIFCTLLEDSLQSYGHDSMLYELRRPVNYFFNRLEYKIDTNPLISHLTQTHEICSSKLGPYCSPINGRNIQQRKIKDWMKFSQMKEIHKVLKDSNPSNAQMAFQIERGQLNAFLISSETYKKYDGFIKQFIKDDMDKEPKPYDYQFKQTDIDFKLQQPSNIQVQPQQQQQQQQQHIQPQQAQPQHKNAPQSLQQQKGSTQSRLNNQNSGPVQRHYTITSKKITGNNNQNNAVNNPNAKQPINNQNKQNININTQSNKNQQNRIPVNVNDRRNINPNSQKANKK